MSMNTDKNIVTETVASNSDDSQESAKAFAHRAAAERRAEHNLVVGHLKELTTLSADAGLRVKNLDTSFGKLCELATQQGELAKSADERLELFASKTSAELAAMTAELEAMRNRIAPPPPVGGTIGRWLDAANRAADRVLSIAKPALVFGAAAGGVAAGGVAAKRAWDRRAARLAASAPPSVQIVPPMTVSVG